MAAMTLIDGVPADTVPVSDRGLLYGDGVFETLVYRQQQLPFLSAHLQRLQRSCEQLGIAVQMDDIRHHLETLLAGLPEAPHAPRDGVVKIIVTRGDGGRGYTPAAAASSRSLVQFHAMPADYAGFARDGIACMLCRHPVSVNRALAGIKHLNRLDQVMASRELAAAQSGVAIDMPALQEGLMFDGRGNLVEGTRSNVFVVNDGQLCTPDLSEAGVSGIMRGALLDWFAGQGVPVSVRSIAASELALASEMFVCNSVMGVWPVNCVHDFSTETRLVFSEQAMARRAQQGLLID